MTRYEPFYDAVRGLDIIEQAYNLGDMKVQFFRLKKEANNLCSGELPLRFDQYADNRFDVHVVFAGRELGTLSVQIDGEGEQLSMMLSSRGEVTKIDVVETSQSLLVGRVTDEDDNPFAIKNDFIDDYYMQYVLSHLIGYVTHQLEKEKYEVKI